MTSALIRDQWLMRLAAEEIVWRSHFLIKRALLKESKVLAFPCFPGFSMGFSNGVFYVFSRFSKILLGFFP